MEPQIFPELMADAAVKSMFGDNPMRIFPWGEVPPNTATPYATYAPIGGNPENTMDKPPQIDNIGTQIDVWGKTLDQCKKATIALRNPLERLGHMISFGGAEKDTETKLYHFRMDFDFFTGR